MGDKLIINKKSLKGEDGHKTFSVRLSDETVERLNELSEKTNRSRNELINILLDYAINNCKVEWKSLLKIKTTKMGTFPILVV